MNSLIKFFKISFLNFEIKDITKEILGIYVPINATTLAKVAAAEIVNKKMKKLFVKDNVLILSNNKDINQIKEILEKNNINYKLDTFFKGRWEGFNEKSLSICFENVSFKKIKKIILEIVKTFNQKAILKSGYHIFLISSLN